MPAAATFAEILAAELDCTEVPRDAGAWHRPLTTPLFVFEPLPRPDLRPAAGGRRSARKVNVPILNPQERQALDALNELGADLLIDDLSSSTLRRAFRRLAHRYHPDRHPGADAAEQQRLARVFVAATAHYRLLAAALTRPDNAGRYEM